MRKTGWLLLVVLAGCNSDPDKIPFGPLNLRPSLGKRRIVSMPRMLNTDVHSRINIHPEASTPSTRKNTEPPRSGVEAKIKAGVEPEIKAEIEAKIKAEATEVRSSPPTDASLGAQRSDLIPKDEVSLASTTPVDPVSAKPADPIHAKPDDPIPAKKEGRRAVSSTEAPPPEDPIRMSRSLDFHALPVRVDPQPVLSEGRDKKSAPSFIHPSIYVGVRSSPLFAQTVSKQIMPGQAISRQLVPKPALPRQSAAGQAVPRQVAPTPKQKN